MGRSDGNFGDTAAASLLAVTKDSGKVAVALLGAASLAVQGSGRFAVTPQAVADWLVQAAAVVTLTLW